MKKYILLILLSWIALPAYSSFCQKILFSYLDVSSDGSWDATVSLFVFEDTVLFVSGADTARFTFTEQQMSDIKNSYSIFKEFDVYGDHTSTKISFDLGRTEYTSESLRLDQNCDSLEVILLKDAEISVFYKDEIYYGDKYFLPPFTDSRSLDLNFSTGTCYNATVGTTRLHDNGISISPYVLRGKVYDSRGLLVRNQSLWHSGFVCMNICGSDFRTNADGSYIFDIYTDKKELNSLTTVFYDQTYPIQPITLGEPFGDTINVDIHLLGPLTEGETAPDAITVQRSGSILHVSGAVCEIALIDASGRGLSCTRSAEVDIAQLPAGIYYLSVTLEDGRVVRHPFNK